MEEGRDRISNLPDPLLHQILSLLPTKTATQTSILSSRWKSIWDSFPVLVFDEELFLQRVRHFFSLLSPEIRDRFLDYVRDSLARRDKSLMTQKFRISCEFQGLISDDRLANAINFAIETNVKELDLSIWTSRPNVFFTPPASLCSAQGLKILRLAYLDVDIDKIMKNSLSIEELVINQCKIPSKVLNISSERLKKFGFKTPCPEVNSLVLDAKNLETFAYIGSFMEAEAIVESCKIDISACKFLKFLTLSGIGILDYEWVEKLIRKLRFLETVDIRACNGVEPVLKIENRNLTTFKLMEWEGEGMIDIDAPRLHTLVYDGLLRPFLTLNSSGKLEAKVSFNGLRSTYDSHDRLPEYLKRFGHCKKVWLVFRYLQDLNYSKDFKANVISPLCEVKYLKVEFTSFLYPIKLKKLVDTLLWLSPHVEMLEILYDTKQLLFELQHEETAIEDGEICFEHPSSCWKHHLKKVKLLKFDANEVEKEILCNYLIQNAKFLESIFDNPPRN